jgi:hypothetical protein
MKPMASRKKGNADHRSGVTVAFPKKYLNGQQSQNPQKVRSAQSRFAMVNP